MYQQRNRFQSAATLTHAAMVGPDDFIRVKTSHDCTRIDKYFSFTRQKTDNTKKLTTNAVVFSKLLIEIQTT